MDELCKKLYECIEEAEQAISPGNGDLPERSERNVIKDYAALKKWQSRPVLTE